MAHRGHRALFPIVLFAALPVFAQTADDRLGQLEKRLDALTHEVTQIRQEIDKLKGGAPAPSVPAATEDLTKVEVAPQTTPQPGQPAPSSALTDVQTVNNVFNPAASKVFNPDTSVIGNFFGRAGQRNPFEFGSGNERPPLGFDEAEIAFQAYVDPYAKANFFFSLSPLGFGSE